MQSPIYVTAVRLHTSFGNADVQTAQDNYEIKPRRLLIPLKTLTWPRTELHRSTVVAVPAV